MIERQPTPDRIVDEHGQVQLGVFRDPLRHIDLARARVVKAGLPLPRAAVRLRLKEWQHYCLDLDDLFVTFAIVDSKFLRVTWCHVVDRRDDDLNENGAWVDGALHHLGPARFEMDAADLLAPWRITTTDGAVELTFTPEGERADNIRLGVIRSVFHQPHGTFRGRVELPDGPLEIDDLHGVCEDHDALW